MRISVQPGLRRSYLLIFMAVAAYKLTLVVLGHVGTILAESFVAVLVGASSLSNLARVPVLVADDLDVRCLSTHRIPHLRFINFY